MRNPLHTQQLVRFRRSTFLYDVVAALCASLILGVALWLPATPQPLSRLYRQLHPLETSPIGTYAWSPPDFSLYVPLAHSAPYALVRQQMTAGATPDSARPMQVTTGATSVTLALHGGTPLRTYTYILPISAPEFLVQFQIAPIAQTSTHDKRVLGIVLANTQISVLKPALLPGPLALALLSLPFALLVCAIGLGIERWRQVIVVGIALIVAVFFWRDPYAVLPTTLALNGGFLMVAALGYLSRQVMARIGTDLSGTLILWAVAAVIGPWTYIAAGLWSHLGRQWITQPLLAGVLLTLPVFAAILYCWQPIRQRGEKLLAAIACIGVLGWGLYNLNFELSHFATDFSAYYYGVERMLHGEPLYELARLREGPFTITYKYHPAFLAFVLPVALAPLDTAILLWRSLGSIWIALGLAIIIANQPSKLRLHLTLIAILLGTNLAPIGQTLRLGQVDPLMFIGIIGAVATMQRFPRASASIWGILGLIKIYPLFLLIPSLFQRQWRWLMLVGTVIVAGAVAALVFGWENQQTYWRDVVPLLGERNGSLANQSLYGLIVRSLNPAIIRDLQANVPTPAASIPFFAAVALIVGISLWHIWRSALWVAPWETTSLLICTMLLIMPVSWDQYQTLLLLPLLLAAAHTLREPKQPSLLLIAAYALLAFGMIKNLWQGTTTPTTFMLLFAAYRTLGLGLLWWWWVRYARMGKKK